MRFSTVLCVGVVCLTSSIAFGADLKSDVEAAYSAWNEAFNKGDAAMWLPDRYDGLGVDGYNRHRCFGVDWRSFRKIFAPSRSFAKARGKKLYVIEAGCVERNPGEKAKWLRGARQTIKAWPEIRAFSYNHEVTDCNYLLTSSPSSFKAFRAMGKDPYFRKR